MEAAFVAESIVGFVARGMIDSGVPEALVEAHLQDIGVDRDRPSTGGRVGFGAYAELWERAERAQAVPHLGLAVAEAIPFGARDLADFALRSAPTLGDLTRLVLELAPCLDGSLIPTVEPVGDTLVLRAGRAPGSTVPAALSDYGMARMLGTLRHVVGERLVPDAVYLTRSAPADPSAHTAFFGCVVHFGHAFEGLSVSAAWMERPLPGADPALHAALLRHLREALAGSAPPATATSVLRRALSELIAEGRAFTQAQVARRLGRSARTLRRELAAEGTSYAEVYDQARLEHAQAALRAGASIEEVSSRVGFASQASFTRTFRRWMGQPPDAWRRARA